MVAPSSGDPLDQMIANSLGRRELTVDMNSQSLRAARAVIAASEKNRSPLAIWASLVSPWNQGMAAPIAWKGPIVFVPTSTANRIPQIEPPAIRPELKRVPAPRSDSSCTPLRRSTHHRTMPPAKMGAVVAIGRYTPTANDNE